MPPNATQVLRTAIEALRKAQAVVNPEVLRSGFFPDDEGMLAIREQTESLTLELQRVNAAVDDQQEYCAARERKGLVYRAFRSALASLRLEVAPEKTLIDLLGVRHWIAAQIPLHRGVLVPVRRLPVDLLKEVFEWVLESFVEERAACEDVVAGMLILTHVCAHWRFVARITPRLWAYLSAPARYLVAPYTNHFLPLSGGYPLQWSSGRDLESLVPFLDVLRLHAARWHSVAFKATTSALSQLEPVGAPALQQASIVALEDYKTKLVSLRFFEDAPHLRTLHLKVQCKSPLISLLPFSALTELVIHVAMYPAAAILAPLYVCARTLETFEYSVGKNLPSNDAVAVYEFRSLKALRLSGEAGPLLAYIIPPALERLTLHDAQAPDKKPELLQHFVVRVPSARETIAFLDVWMDGLDDLEQLAHLARSVGMLHAAGLEELRFCGSRVPDYFFEPFDAGDRGLYVKVVVATLKDYLHESLASQF